MNKQALQKINANLEVDLQHYSKRLALTRASTILEDDMASLDKELLVAKTLFHNTLETWWKDAIDKELDPFVIDQDRHVARIYDLGALLSILLEVGLAGWISYAFRFPLWAGIPLALILPGILEAVLTFSLWKRERPRETLDKLKKWLLKPSASLFGAAALFLLLYRVLPVKTAVTLEPLVNVGLWITTISSLLMAGALLTAGRIYNWSYRDANKHKQLTQERQESHRYREEFKAELSITTGAPEHKTMTAVASQSPDGAIAKTATVLLALIFLSPFATSCGPNATGSGIPPDLLKAADRPQAAELEIFVDASKSPGDVALSEAAQNVNNSIIGIVERWNVVQLQIYEFGRDGFIPTEKKSFIIEPMEMAQLEDQELEELRQTENFRPDVKEEKVRELRAKLARRQADLKTNYLDKMRASLKGLSPEMLLPSSPIEPRCTDVDGVFRRISMINELGRQHLILVLTDAVHNCGAPATSISPPVSAVMLVVVLCPEKIQPRAGGPLDITSSDVYDRQAAELSKAVSWSSIVPPFTDDFNNAFEKAKVLRERLAKPAR